MKRKKVTHYIPDRTLRNICDDKLTGDGTFDRAKTTCPKCKRTRGDSKRGY